MSEPTYRVELQQRNDPAWPWVANVYRVADGEYLVSRSGKTYEDAFDEAQLWVRALAHPLPKQFVHLTEDGDLLDPAEVQR